MSVTGENRLIDGVYSLLLTPFKDSGEINYTTYEQYVEWQLSQQPQALFASCGSSELLFLTASERIRLAEIAVEKAGATPVVATANAGKDPAMHREELLRMADTGVSALVVIPPNGYGTDASRLEQYFAELADSSPLPIILYEYPGVSPYEIPASVYGSLFASGKVVGIKDTTSTLAGITDKLSHAPNSTVFQANTAFLPPSIQAGVRGIMAITSTAKADLNIKLWYLIKQNGGKLDKETKAIHRELVCLDALLSNGFTATAKYLVNLQGIPFNLKTRTGAITQPAVAESIRVWYERLEY